MGRDRSFFGKVAAAGSHEASLRLLLAGDVDATALDSTVLDLLRRRDPSLERRLRAKGGLRAGLIERASK